MGVGVGVGIGSGAGGGAGGGAGPSSALMGSPAMGPPGISQGLGLGGPGPGAGPGLVGPGPGSGQAPDLPRPDDPRFGMGMNGDGEWCYVVFGFHVMRCATVKREVADVEDEDADVGDANV